MLKNKTITFFITLSLITIHAFLMNGHYYVHRYLTVGTYIDPIVARADPSLFKKSIFIQAVNRTGVRLSLLDKVFPLIYQYLNFEAYAIVQEILTLFFILAGIFVLTQSITHSRGAGYLAMLLYTKELNNWTLGSPSPYLNFFHHSLLYTYPLLIWSLVFFFQNRYILSFLLAGISWNFHLMCTLFLLFAYLIYWLFHHQELTPKRAFSWTTALVIPALPTLIKIPSYIGSTTSYDQIWLTVARWTAWFTCFPSTWTLFKILRSILYFILFGISLYFLPDKKKRNSISIFIFSVGVLCFLGTLFAEIYPLPSLIKLSLFRSTLIYLFLALPSISYLMITLFHRGMIFRFLVTAICTILTGYVLCFKLYYFPILVIFLILFNYESSSPQRIFVSHETLLQLLVASLFALFLYQALFDQGALRLIIFFSFTLTFLLLWRFLELKQIMQPKRLSLFLTIFILFFDLGILYHKGGPEIYYRGRIQGKPDPWADIQIFAKNHSYKDDLFIIPPYLNDFGIYSLRATLGDWAEGSNGIYLDQQFNHEWYNRMRDLGWQKLFGAEEGYNQLTTEEIIRVAQKYGAKFVITEKPKIFSLKKIYENEKFILYEIL